MEANLILNQLPVPEMEPVSQLAPYLNGLDAPEALESFGQLADHLLAIEQQSSTSSCYSGSNGPEQWLFGSPSSCSTTSSPSSSYNNSLASSPSHSWSSLSPGSSTSGATRGKRRSKNATAAERYRRKLRGRNCGLLEQVEREQARNSRLRIEIESKLTLYREFVNLLAANTSSSDLDLAGLGSRSLLNIASSKVLDQTIDPSLAFELQLQLERFQRILLEKSPTQ